MSSPPSLARLLPPSLKRHYPSPSLPHASRPFTLIRLHRRISHDAAPPHFLCDPTELSLCIPAPRPLCPASRAYLTPRARRRAPVSSLCRLRRVASHAYELDLVRPSPAFPVIPPLTILVILDASASALNGAPVLQLLVADRGTRTGGACERRRERPLVSCPSLAGVSVRRLPDVRSAFSRSSALDASLYGTADMFGWVASFPRRARDRSLTLADLFSLFGACLTPLLVPRLPYHRPQSDELVRGQQVRQLDSTQRRRVEDGDALAGGRDRRCVRGSQCVVPSLRSPMAPPTRNLTRQIRSILGTGAEQGPCVHFPSSRLSISLLPRSSFPLSLLRSSRRATTCLRNCSPRQSSHAT